MTLILLSLKLPNEQTEQMILLMPSTKVTMKYEKTISVILPVYNVEPWIGDCIESLKKQNLDGLEFIFVDDCGTDGSIKAVETWAAEDDRVVILRNEHNIGSGPSRNRGIEAAEGEYLSFIDPDDYISDDYYMTLFRLAKEKDLDIIKGGRVMRALDNSLVESRYDLNKDIKQGLKEGRPLYTVFTYDHQGTLFRSSLIKDNGITYGISTRAQDKTFLLRVCRNTNSLGIADNAVYYFCERTDSAMHQVDAKHLMGVLDSVSERVDEVLLYLKDDSYAEAYLTGVFKAALKEFERYSYEGGQEDVMREYLHGLGTELRRLPFYNTMKTKSFSLCMLAEQEIGLASAPYRLPWMYMAAPEAHAELIRKWKRAFRKYPREGKKGLGEYISLFNRARESASYYGNDKLRILLIKEGFLGLSPYLIMYMMYYAITRKLRKIIGQ